MPMITLTNDEVLIKQYFHSILDTSIVALGKTLYSHSASLSNQVYEWLLANLMLGVTLRWTSIPSSGE